MASPDFAFLFRSLDDDDAVVSSSRASRASRMMGVRLTASDADRVAHEILLADRLAHNDATVFDEVFRYYFAPLVAYVRRFVDSLDTAEDLAQDALIHIWETRATIRSDVPLTSLLRTIVRRAALKRLRHLRVVDRVHSTMTNTDDVPHARAADGTIGRAEVVQTVHAALATLPPRTRLVAIMRWLDGIGRQEIAAELGVSVRTVDAQLYQAAAKIRAAIAPYRIESAD